MKKWIFVLLLIGIVFVSGCVESPETQQFVESLPQTNENLGIDMGNVNSRFHNYNLEYDVTRLMNLAFVPDSILSGMQEGELKITEYMSSAETSISNYQSLKQNIKITHLSEEEQNIVNQIEEKITDFNSNKAQIESCIENMETYRELIALSKEKTELVEDFAKETTLMNNYIDSEDYENAKGKVDELQEIIRRMKEKDERKIALGIITVPQEVMDSYDVYLEAYELYGEYIEFYEAGDTINAGQKYTEHLNKYNEALELESNTMGLSETINEVDSWYQDNIGVCFDIFEEYS